jgi:hypothetical protein
LASCAYAATYPACNTQDARTHKCVASTSCRGEKRPCTCLEHHKGERTCNVSRCPNCIPPPLLHPHPLGQVLRAAHRPPCWLQSRRPGKQRTIIAHDLLATRMQYVGLGPCCCCRSFERHGDEPRCDVCQVTRSQCTANNK